MPQPIWNIIHNAGLDAKKMGSIENTATNVKKLRMRLEKNGKIRYTR